MQCPLYRARPEGFYRVNQFITPNDSSVYNKARELIRYYENKIEACFNFVSISIRYVSDKRQYGYGEYWAFPSETLRYRVGDCEDTSFLLASLLLASGIPDENVRVVLGRYNYVGHAWVEVLTNEGWYILESTSDRELTIGYNALKQREGYQRGYSPELYVYHHSCEQVGRRGLYDRQPLYYY